MQARSSLHVIAFVTASSLIGCLTPATEAEELGATRQDVKACSAATGQAHIGAGRYSDAIREFSCVIAADPTNVEGYRGRIEANLMLGNFAAATTDYARVTAVVIPAHPDAATTILAGYAARLAANPSDVVALTGASYANWWFFQYAAAAQKLDALLSIVPDDVYGNLFRGSSRLLQGAAAAQGYADLERAIALAPTSPDVRFIVADAFTYGAPNPTRALAEANQALAGGVDTPRIQAILGAAYNALGDGSAAAEHIATHIDRVTEELVITAPLATKASTTLALVPGRTYEIPLTVNAGQTISIVTNSPGKTIWDSIAVLLDPNGTPVVGSDDAMQYYAAFDYVAAATGTYTLQVTSFESVSTGSLAVGRN